MASNNNNKVPTLKLNTGHELPVIGLGTWKSQPGEVENAVIHALTKANYTHLDCASIYQNEKEIGTALQKVYKEGNLKREDIFITSKVFNHFHGSVEKVSFSLDRTLKDLQTDYVDLLLVHWPCAFIDVVEPLPRPLRNSDGTPVKELQAKFEYIETWKSFEKIFKETKKVKAIGVSNFTVEQLKEVIEKCDIVPAVNQVEFHPYLVQSELAKFCKEKGIVLEAYSPLGSGDSYSGKLAGAPKPLLDPVIAEIAKEHNCTSAQVIIKWSVQSGNVVLPKSVTPSRINQNIELFNITLTSANMETINKLNKDHRFGWGWLPGHFIPESVYKK